MSKLAGVLPVLPVPRVTAIIVPGASGNHVRVLGPKGGGAKEYRARHKVTRKPGQRRGTGKVCAPRQPRTPRDRTAG